MTKENTKPRVQALNPKYWFLTAAITWFAFACAYWLIPDSLQVTNVHDSLYIETTKNYLQRSIDLVFEGEKTECIEQDFEFACHKELPKSFICNAFNEDECVDKKATLILITQAHDKDHFAGDLSIIIGEKNDKENLLINKSKMTIYLPNIAVYITNIKGLVFDIEGSRKITDIFSGKKLDFSIKKLISTKAVKTDGNYFYPFKYTDEYLDKLRKTYSGFSRTPAFTRALYFSGITLLSIGYGDIIPMSNIARILAILEGLIGLVLIANISVTFYERLKIRLNKE